MKYNRINVTKSVLPPREKFDKYVDEIYNSVCLTNQGSLVRQLNAKLREYLQVPRLEFVSNGTLALMLALQALDISGCEVITTPFTYVATTSTILWQNCKPVFVDIEPKTLCIDPNKIEEKITSKTRAILAVHVYGFPCDIEGIQAIADKYGLKVIYDGAHAFGARYKGKSLLDYGDVSVCSFHATKLFHTVEGGAIIAKDEAVHEKVQLSMRFGHNGDEHFCLGINAKNSEFHAAMGLAGLDSIEESIRKRKSIAEVYDEVLKGKVYIPRPNSDCQRNYINYPIVLRDGEERMRILEETNSVNVFPRRYFYPSLNMLPYLDEYQECPISESIADRVLCLPLYPDLSEEDQDRINTAILKALNGVK